MIGIPHPPLSLFGVMPTCHLPHPLIKCTAEEQLEATTLFCFLLEACVFVVCTTPPLNLGLPGLLDFLGTTELVLCMKVR